jgi:hypothetical protein
MDDLAEPVSDALQRNPAHWVVIALRALKIRRCLAPWGFNSPSRHHPQNPVLHRGLVDNRLLAAQGWLNLDRVLLHQEAGGAGLNLAHGYRPRPDGHPGYLRSTKADKLIVKLEGSVYYADHSPR